ncbi:hypothetical protein VTJ49DRAFT_2225 [Mycothermus thermophilus]|uniref:CFEM domain-containing protein n=1 Tax=Humicola insolens TaxID=85995 RepID=A0ABR3VA95_HUMIN
MEPKTLLVAAMAGLVAAQTPDLGGIPTCAIDCIINTNPLSGCQPYPVIDFPCLCLTGEPYNSEIARCIVNACTNFDDVLKMVQWKTDTCAMYGIVWP